MFTSCGSQSGRPVQPSPVIDGVRQTGRLNIQDGRGRLVCRYLSPITFVYSPRCTVRYFCSRSADGDGRRMLPFALTRHWTTCRAVDCIWWFGLTVCILIRSIAEYFTMTVAVTRDPFITVIIQLWTLYNYWHDSEANFYFNFA